MKMFKSKCSQCGATFRRKTLSEVLSAMRQHLWKQHRRWMIDRIKMGQRKAQVNNPSIQDLVQALQKGSSRAAQTVARQMTEARYQQVKPVMDAVQPVLPLKAQLVWEGIEAAHDIYRRVKGKRGK